MESKRTTSSVEDDIVSLRSMQVAGWIYLLIVVIGSWLFVSWSFALSVFVGGVISILSFVVSSKDVIGFFDSIMPLTQDEGEEKENKEKVKKSKTGFLIKFWFRIAIIGILLLLFIKSGKANVFGLILGLSTVVFTVTFAAVNVARRYFFSGRR